MVVAICFASMSVSAQQTPMIVKHEVASNADDIRHDYPIALLNKIFSHADVPIVLEAVPVYASFRRLERLFEAGEINVGWGGTRTQGEVKGMREIRYPIYKGLLGYRIALVHKDNVNLLKSVSDLDSLAKLVIGQRNGWPEVALFKSNNLNVVAPDDYMALFTMLDAKRFDLFPRSILEIWFEFEARQHLDITIDQHIIIRYPHAMFYYVHENDDVLYNYIETGFQKIIASGEYEELFKRHASEYIKQSNLPSRTIIDVPNPRFVVPENEKDRYYRPLK